MALSLTDLVFVLSGGVTNDSPKKSLGGYPSPVFIKNNSQNLFSNLEPREASDGKIDYRCFYLFNDNLTDDFHNIRVWLEKTTDTSLVQLGLLAQNESQLLSFSEPDPTASGTFVLKIDNQLTSDISFDTDQSILTTNIQNAIIALPNMDDVIVTNTATNQYTVSFTGNRAISLILIQDNTITPSISIVPSRIQAGSPINTIAELVNDELTAPSGIAFSLGIKPGILIGTLRPGEGFPVWIQRNTPAGAPQANGDNFSIHCKVSS